MLQKYLGRLLALGLIVIVGMVGNSATACTGIRIKTKDGTVIYARTLEFGIDLQSQMIIIPRGMDFVGTLPQQQPGAAWKAKYGVVGANGFGLTQIIDGTNEHGLASGIFYMPGYAKFPAATTNDTGRGLAPWEYVTWMLTNFATVAEVRQNLDRVQVCDVVQDQMGITPPVHYVVHDASGDSIVIEYLNGVRRVYDNPLGVITNNPSFDWHLTNLDNYVNLTPKNAPSQTLTSLTVNPLGQGSGLLGLPGDFTPPSRFVRAAILSQVALPVATAEEGINLANHILNSFDIVKGDVREVEHGQVGYERTDWTTYHDLRNKIVYFRTYENSRVRKLDLSKIDFDATGVRSVPMNQPEVFEDLTSQAK